MLGHLDPELHEILLDVVDMLRRVYRAQGGLVLPLQATGTSGMEAGLANLVEPGETVIVGVQRLLRHADRRDRPALRRRGGRGQRGLGRARPERAPARGPGRPPRHPPAGRRPRGDLDRLRASAGGTRRRDARARHPADGGLRHHPGRGRGGLRRLGDRLRLLLHPEVPGRAARHVADRGLGSSAGAHPRQAAAGPVLDRPAAARRPTGSSGRRPTTTRRPSSTSTRSTRSSGGPSTRVSSAAGPGTPRPGPTSSSWPPARASSSWRNRHTSSRR